jgi:nucleosome binding factor SPN SPT16 subunit
VLNIKNDKPLRAGQVFTVSLGVSGLENADATDARAKTYALQVRCLSVWLCSVWLIAKHRI